MHLQTRDLPNRSCSASSDDTRQSIDKHDTHPHNIVFHCNIHALDPSIASSMSLCIFSSTLSNRNRNHCTTYRFVHSMSLFSVCERGGTGGSVDSGCSATAVPSPMNVCASAFGAPATSQTVRRATKSDLWKVAEVHTASFFPEEGFPLVKVRTLDRYWMLESAIADRTGRYVCLVAEADAQDMLNNQRYITGCVNVDTVGGNLPLPKRTSDPVRTRTRLRRRREKIAYVSNLAVDAAYRRRGLAKMLMEEAEDTAKEWGCSSLALHYDIADEGVAALYRGLGYRMVGIEPQWNSYLYLRPNIRFGLMLKRIPTKGKKP